MEKSNISISNDFYDFEYYASLGVDEIKREDPELSDLMLNSLKENKVSDRVIDYHLNLLDDEVSIKARGMGYSNFSYDANENKAIYNNESYDMPDFVKTEDKAKKYTAFLTTDIEATVNETQKKFEELAAKENKEFDDREAQKAYLKNEVINDLNIAGVKDEDIGVAYEMANLNINQVQNELIDNVNFFYNKDDNNAKLKVGDDLDSFDLPENIINGRGAKEFIANTLIDHSAIAEQIEAFKVTENQDESFNKNRGLHSSIDSYIDYNKEKIGSDKNLGKVLDNLHEKLKGHTLVIGESGTGKTVLKNSVKQSFKNILKKVQAEKSNNQSQENKNTLKLG